MFDINLIKMLEDYQKSNFYRAKVINLDDSKKINRIQINIFGLTDDIPDESLPWCEIQFKSGLITYPKIDDIIWIYFESNDIFKPIYIGTIYTGINISKSNGLKKYKENYSFANDSDYLEKIKEVNDLENNEDVIIKDNYNQFKNVYKDEEIDWYVNKKWVTSNNGVFLDDFYGNGYKRILKWNELKNKSSSFWSHNDKEIPWAISEEFMETEGVTPITTFFPTFPMSKINLDEFKPYKVHYLDSNMGKSRIELDDNDDYERLRIDFNYGEGGLEFSKKGLNGVDFWTKGVFHLWAGGDPSENGGNTKFSSYANIFTFNNSSWRTNCDGDIEFFADSGISCAAENFALFQAKSGSVAIAGGAGVAIMSANGRKMMMAQGNADFPGLDDAEKGVIMSNPILIGDGTQKGNAKLNSWVFGIDAKTNDDEIALSFAQNINMAFKFIYELHKAIKLDQGATGFLPNCTAAVDSYTGWLTGLNDNIGEGAVISVVNLVSSHPNIVIESGGNKGM